MAKKKRKLNVINLLILLGICLCMGLGFVVFTYKTKTVSINPEEINNIDYSEWAEASYDKQEILDKFNEKSISLMKKLNTL